MVEIYVLVVFYDVGILILSCDKFILVYLIVVVCLNLLLLYIFGGFMCLVLNMSIFDFGGIIVKLKKGEIGIQ